MSRKRRYNRAPYRATNSPNWSFVEQFCPGARAAWGRDVGLPDAGFMFGVSGDPMRAIASTREWTSTPPDRRRYFEYLVSERAWRAVKLRDNGVEWKPGVEGLRAKFGASLGADLREKKWNALCPVGKHGLDYEGQDCDLCTKDIHT